MLGKRNSRLSYLDATETDLKVLCKSVTLFFFFHLDQNKANLVDVLRPTNKGFISPTNTSPNSHSLWNPPKMFNTEVHMGFWRQVYHLKMTDVTATGLMSISSQTHTHTFCKEKTNCSSTYTFQLVTFSWKLCTISFPLLINYTLVRTF